MISREITEWYNGDSRIEMRLGDRTRTQIVSSLYPRAPDNAVDRESWSEHSSKHLRAQSVRDVSYTNVKNIDLAQDAATRACKLK
jgi:hypothetical protein